MGSTGGVHAVLDVCVSLRLGECMKLSLVNCDGGQKDDNHRPDAMVTNLPNTTSSKLYQSSFCQKIFAQ